MHRNTEIDGVFNQNLVYLTSFITYLQMFLFNQDLSPREEKNIVRTFHPHSADLASAFIVP